MRSWIRSWCWRGSVLQKCDENTTSDWFVPSCPLASTFRFVVQGFQVFWKNTIHKQFWKVCCPFLLEESAFLLLFGFLFSSVCQQSSLLPPPLYSLNPLRFHRASRYSRVSIATPADMQQVSMSSGTGFSALPLAAQSAPGGSDWLAGPSWLMVFTGMRRRADWSQTQKEKKPRRKKKRRLQERFHRGIKRVKMEEAG